MPPPCAGLLSWGVRRQEGFGVRIVLAAVEDDLADAWERYCGDLSDVSVHRGSILDLSVDAVVSPANSFGFMDGGIDQLYSHRFGWEVQEQLQGLIRTRHNGELLVGAAEIVETGHPRISYVIAAPTMRVPMVLADTVNSYLAARAVLLLIKQGVVPSGVLAGEPVAAAVQSVAFPGLGTGVGRVGPNTCAHQVRAAIEEVVLGRGHYPRTWAEAQQRHQLLYTDRVRDLQRG
jgi:O-acetyl-ADP-ribose deacetylase (regulator of RNase III)